EKRLFHAQSLEREREAWEAHREMEREGRREVEQEASAEKHFATAQRFAASAARKCMALMLRSKGMKLREIGELLGVSRQRVDQMIHPIPVYARTNPQRAENSVRRET